MSKVKIQDLSVGDWVCAVEKVGVHNEPRHTLPMKIVALGEDWVQLCLDPEQGDPFEYTIDEIRGIPLSGEIFETIGVPFQSDFSRKRKVIQRYADWTSVIHLSAWLSENHCQIGTEDLTLGNWISIRRNNKQPVYVHEFQHMLRIAGVEKEIEL